MLTTHRASRVHFFGDSITAPGAATWWLNFFYNALVGFYRPTQPLPSAPTKGTQIVPYASVAKASGIVPYPSFDPPAIPTITVNGVGGRTTGDVVGQIGTFVGAYSPTVVFCELGVNDARAAVDAVTFASNVASITSDITAIVGASNWAWIGPWCSGEMWPTGANAYDDGPTGITAKDAALASMMAAAGVGYISMRQAWAIAEPIMNPGNLGQGVLTFNESPGVGLHPQYPLGKQHWSDAVLPHVSFAE